MINGMINLIQKDGKDGELEIYDQHLNQFYGLLNLTKLEEQLRITS